jgi:hypothetical protein
MVSLRIADKSVGEAVRTSINTGHVLGLALAGLDLLILARDSKVCACESIKLNASSRITPPLRWGLRQFNSAMSSVLQMWSRSASFSVVGEFVLESLSCRNFLLASGKRVEIHFRHSR